MRQSRHTNLWRDKTIETAALNQLIIDAFTGKMTWLEASKRYPVDEFVAAFYQTRAAMQRTLDKLTDDQVSYTTTTTPLWSLSETVTHLIFSQNGYHNWLLDLSAPFTPHIVEAARGFGEGAKTNIPAAELRAMLAEATERIRHLIEQTLPTQDPLKIVANPLFGRVNYPTLIVLLCAHETDHVRQAIVMRRLSRNFTDRSVSPPKLNG